jgi:hypothetical protein
MRKTMAPSGKAPQVSLPCPAPRASKWERVRRQLGLLLSSHHAFLPIPLPLEAYSHPKSENVRCSSCPKSQTSTVLLALFSRKDTRLGAIAVLLPPSARNNASLFSGKPPPARFPSSQIRSSLLSLWAARGARRSSAARIRILALFSLCLLTSCRKGVLQTVSGSFLFAQGS